MSFYRTRFDRSFTDSKFGGPIASFAGPLDAFSAPDVAVSLRQRLLTSWAGALFQAREVGTDATVEVSPTASGSADTAPLLALAPGVEKRVASLYDQTGNARHFEQADGQYQCVVVESSDTLVAIDDAPAMRGLRPPGASPIGGTMTALLGSTYSAKPFTVFLRAKHGAYSGIFAAIADEYFAAAKGASIAGTSAGMFQFERRTDASFRLAGAFSTFASGALNADMLVSIIFDGTNVTVRDGTNTWSGANNMNFDIDRLLLNAFADGNQEYSATVKSIQECVVWLSDQTTNEAAIRAALIA